MKKTILTILLIIVLSIGTACTKKETAKYKESTNNNILYETEDANESDETKELQKTIMDLFEGKKRIWFMLGTNIDGISYDSDVNAVIVTENKKVISVYYNMVGNINKSYIKNVVKINQHPNPFSHDYFVMSDFANLNDEQIIDMVSESYANASITYSFQLDNKNYTFEGNLFPYDVKYNGILDNSGNFLKSETLKFFKHSYYVPGGYLISLDSTFPYKEFISPIIIKDKEYVGILCYSNGYSSLITVNNFEHIEEPIFDNIEGITSFE